MDDSVQTLELARIYESQGYYQDAFQIYSFLNEHHPDSEIEAGFSRMKKRLDASYAGELNNDSDDLKTLIGAIEPDLIDENQADASDATLPQNGVAALVEQWFSLMMIEAEVKRVMALNR